MVNLRKLVALDMVLHGTRFIVAEFVFGVVLLFVFGLLSILPGIFDPKQPIWQTISGYWLIGMAVNYVPMLIYAILIARGGTVKAEGEAELAHVKRYNIQQFIIFIPLLVAIAALIQEVQRRKEK